MRQALVIAALLSGLWAGLPFSASIAEAASPAERVETAFHELNRWLGDGANGNKWRTFIMADALREQLARGESADPAVLREIAARMDSGAKGLDLPRFVAVRQALTEWQQSLPPIAASQLADAARQARQHFRAATENDVAAAKAEVVRRARLLDRFLASGPKSHRAGWHAFLDWDGLQSQLAANGSPNDMVLRAVRDKLISNETGLERNEFTGLRAAIDHYRYTLELAGSPRAQELMEKFLDELAERLEKFNTQPATDDAVAIGTLIGQLDHYGQAPELVSAVRHHYWQPNLYLNISEGFLKSGIDAPVDDHTPVREVILGTRVFGKAHTLGQISADVAPSDTNGTLRIDMRGTSRSSNVGYNGPVTIYTSGITDVHARTFIYLTDNGLIADDADAECSTSTSINGIAANKKIVRKIATRRANASKGRAEQIASRKAEHRVENRVDSQVAEMLVQGNDYFLNKFKYPLVRRDGFPRRFDVRSTDDAINLTVMQAGAGHLAAFNQPPDQPAGFAVTARLHETFVGNFSEAALGGVTLTDEQIADMMLDLTGKVPDDLVVTEDSEPWSITFAQSHPVDARFGDNRVTIVLNGDRLTRGKDGGTDKPVRISATYDVQKTPQGARLVRDGDVQVELLNQPQTGARNTILRSFIRTKFRALFKEEIDRKGIQLGGRWEKAGELQLDHLNFGNTWVALGWNLVPIAAPAQVAVRDQ
jgi:hypothetical protein